MRASRTPTPRRSPVPALLGRVVLAAAFAALATRKASAAGGAPFDSVDDHAHGEAHDPVWDLSKPLWIFFVQERLLVPEMPPGEAIPRLAFAHMRPAGEDGRLFFILAGIAYLGLYHYEVGPVELEASVFTMLYPVGSPLYRDGSEAVPEGYEETWTDASLRAMKTWGLDTPRRIRAAVEYQLADRDYHRTDDTAATFVLPGDTLVHEAGLTFAVDTRSRGRMGDFARGWEFEAGATHEVRTAWNAWGAGGTEYDDPDAERATTLFGSFEYHREFGSHVPLTLHAKLRGAQGSGLDRLTYMRLGGGGFGRQFDRVGAGSAGAANDGELFRSDGVPGHFGGEFLTDRYVQVNLEFDLPTSEMSAFHVSGAWARFTDVLEPGDPWTDLVGFGLGYTKILGWESAMRLDLGYSPRPDGAFDDAGDVTFTYLRKF